MCQPKDGLVSLDPEVGVPRCLAVLGFMGVQVQECFCVVSTCGAEYLGVWVWGSPVSGYQSVEVSVSSNRVSMH